jgi:hypothetical protein
MSPFSRTILCKIFKCSKKLKSLQTFIFRKTVPFVYSKYCRNFLPFLTIGTVNVCLVFLGPLHCNNNFWKKRWFICKLSKNMILSTNTMNPSQKDNIFFVGSEQSGWTKQQQQHNSWSTVSWSVSWSVRSICHHAREEPGDGNDLQSEIQYRILIGEQVQ